MIKHQCVYCLNWKDEKEFNREHVIPQFLGTFSNNLVLNELEVCKECNSFFSKNFELEQSNTILGAIREIILNKSSKNSGRDFSKTMTIKNSTASANEIFDDVKKYVNNPENTDWYFEPIVFDAVFSQETIQLLTKITFNCFIKIFGKSTALLPEFSEIRNYIRKGTNFREQMKFRVLNKDLSFLYLIPKQLDIQINFGISNDKKCYNAIINMFNIFELLICLTDNVSAVFDISSEITTPNILFDYSKKVIFSLISNN